MHIRTSWASLVGLLIAMFAATPVTVAAEASAPPSSSPVVQLSVVTARDPDGLVRRFTDHRNREFKVTYDSDRRMQAIESVRGPNLSDIVRITYAPNGRLGAVQFRTGYSLFFDDRPNGARVVRDTRGAGIIQVGSSNQAIDGAPAEHAGELVATVNELESLIEAISASKLR